MDQETFKMILLAVVGFFCGIGVKQLMSIAKSVNAIKVELGIIITKQDIMQKDQDEMKLELKQLKVKHR